jgi:iron complex outermembrane receptor protein
LSGSLALVDRVEILRGPTSVLYGQGDPGGSINLVLKRARPVFGLSTSATLDTVGTRLAYLDVTGPIVGTSLSARLVAQGENSDTFRDFEKNRRIQIAPVIHAEPWAGATIDALGSYDRYDFTAIRDYLVFDPAYFTIQQLQKVSLSRNYSEPTLPLSRFDTWTFRVEGTQRLSDRWLVGANFYSYFRSTEAYSELVTYDLIPGTTVHNRNYRHVQYPGGDFGRSRTYSAFARGDVDLLGINHKLYIGYEHLFADLEYNDEGGAYLPIDIADPVYQTRFVPPPSTPGPTGGQKVSTDAVFANDLISISSQVKLQLGLRYDWIRSSADSSVPISIRDHKLSPSAGIVWQPADATSLYASYSTAFVPNLGITRLGTALRPERSKAYEIGVKQELIDRRLAVTLAGYRIDKVDIVQDDPLSPAGNFQVNGGSARSEGFELEFEGRPGLTGLSVRGGVAYANARIVKSSDFSPGDKLVGQRPWTALLSLRQTLDPLGLARAWISASVSYGGSQQSEIPANGQIIPSYTRIDLAAAKAFGPVELQINLKNLTDDRIFINNGGGRVVFDNPRSFGATLRYRFGSLR